MKRTLFAVTLAALLPAAALGDDMSDALQTFLDNDVAVWAKDARLVAAIRTQNEANAGLDEAQIDALDKAWRAEVGSGNTPTITPVLDHPASDFLRGIVDEKDGTVAEIIVMDAHGLNVAISHVTSDFWQGDEDKHIKTYGAGPTGSFVDAVEFDESTNAYIGQVSMTVVDPDSGEPIGAITVGVNAESLF